VHRFWVLLLWECDRSFSFFAGVVFIAAVAGLPAHAQDVTVPTGNTPDALAVNSVTNTIYVANFMDNTVSVINGATNGSNKVSVGSGPSDIAVNPVTNTIYVANLVDNTVTVINGATNATTTVAVGPGPVALAVNPVTNMVYVADAGADNDANGTTVTVIDGSTNATTTVTVATGGGVADPVDLAVNAVTNQIYVVNAGGVDGGVNVNDITVINGTTNATTTVHGGDSPFAVAVNPVTNMAYVPNYLGGTVTVINGATNATATVTVGSNPDAVAVNPVTNKIYVTNNQSASVTVIDGATNATTTVAVGADPFSIVADPTTNQIYVANAGSASVTVIDGATNATTTVAAGNNTDAFEGNFSDDIAVNTVTHTVYVDGSISNTMTVIPESASAAPTPTPTPAPTPTPVGTSGGSSSARLINISTRAQVGTGANILIPGFVIGGSGTETLLIRADGPALTGFGVAGALAQPSLSVFDSSGNVVASNTGWGTNANPAQIASAAASVGAFALASGSADCALIAALPAGAYTVQVSGVGNSTGVALAEVYEVSYSGTSLVNISTRAEVGTGANIIIPGFVISGGGSDQLLARADGPALTGFGVGGALAQPSLSVFDNSGNVIASNTGWGTNSNAAQIASAASTVGAFALAAGSADSALIVNLSAGAYTMQISGVNNSTGVALAEIYEVP